MVAIGMIIGLVAAIGTSPIVAKLLFGVSVRDPMIYIMAFAVLISMAVVACFIPAYKATRVDPVTIIKS